MISLISHTKVYNFLWYGMRWILIETHDGFGNTQGPALTFENTIIRTMGLVNTAGTDLAAGVDACTRKGEPGGIGARRKRYACG